MNCVLSTEPIYTIVLDYVCNNEKIERLANSYDDLGIALESYYMFVKYLKKRKGV
ncbi:MAG: hypothetical protein HFI87_02060 [Bacilli bacterium]|nr:hypothetical protein [Bacilli bacterium]